MMNSTGRLTILGTPPARRAAVVLSLALLAVFLPLPFLSPAYAPFFLTVVGRRASPPAETRLPAAFPLEPQLRAPPA